MQTITATLTLPSKPLPELIPSAQTPVEPTTANEIALHAIANRITNTDPAALHLFNSYNALKAMRERFAREAAASILWQAGNGVTKLSHHPAQAKLESHFSNGFADELGKLAALDSGLLAIESEPGLAAAIELLGPMNAERERLQELVAQERQAKAEAHAAAERAHTAALERAKIAAANDREVIATRAALAAFDPPAPPPPPALTRGRQKLASESNDLAANFH